MIRGRVANRSKGVALMAALILVLALVMVLGNIFYRHQIDVSQSSAALHSDQAMLMVLSAESWARQRLSNNPSMDNIDVDHLGEVWAQALPALPMEGGAITGCIRDLQARVNLNNFALFTPESLELELKTDDDQPLGMVLLWRRLLELSNIPYTHARSGALVDWLDKDSERVNEWGAEQGDYDGLRIPRVVANTPMTDASELAAIIGYQHSEVLALMPLVTALPLSGRSSLGTTININTAPISLLFAMAGASSEAFVEAVLSARNERRHFDSLAEFHDELERNLPLTRREIETRWPARIIDVRSNFFQLYIDVSLGDTKLEVKSVIDRRKDPSNPTILARDISVVPKFIVPLDEPVSDIDMYEEANLTIGSQDAETYHMHTACRAIGV
ncbi:MAG: general secretion pathway protein GspK [Cellvibrionales bacterium TMED148]|nr:hypothetical protein [Porticoccaceae bacterium]RPG89980.1 MAG: general secretion pathway protein GspK [Cellvibrionales bacterium TMED148]